MFSFSCKYAKLCVQEAFVNFELELSSSRGNCLHLCFTEDVPVLCLCEIALFIALVSSLKEVCLVTFHYLLSLCALF